MVVKNISKSPDIGIAILPSESSKQKTTDNGKTKFELINRTDFHSDDITEIVRALLDGQLAPKFYLICQTPKHDGLSITNLDKPIIIITVKDLNQFTETFVHELRHLQQHMNDYASEDFDREVVVTDKKKVKA